MKGVPIKFRGKDYEGKWQYGYYARMAGYPYIIKSNGDREIVDGNTVSQLIGYDANGAEIYEGDKLIDIDWEYSETAELRPRVPWKFYNKENEND